MVAMRYNPNDSGSLFVVYQRVGLCHTYIYIFFSLLFYILLLAFVWFFFIWFLVGSGCWGTVRGVG